MRIHRFVWPAVAVALLAAPTAAQLAAIPDPDHSEVHFVSGGEGPYTVVARLDGLGTPLTAAYAPGGGTGDARIEFVLRDSEGRPVAGYPCSEFWLEPLGGTTNVCPWGFPPRGLHAAHDTDAEGRAWVTGPLYAGGWWDGDWVLRAQVWGAERPAPALHWNSPDINGDLRVDLTDGGFFTADLYGGYAFRSDVVYDGVINLSDAGLLTQVFGRPCF